MKLVDKVKNKIGNLYAEEISVKFYRNLINKNDLVFDVGANHGNRTKIFLRLSDNVISIEPNPKLANKLKQKYKTKITVVQKALGKEVGFIDLYINDADVLSTTSKSFIESAKRTDRFGKLSDKFNTIVNVEMINIQDLFGKYGHPSFLKIDVEGLEYEIIKTLKDNKVKVLSFEFALPETSKETILSIEYLKSIGYEKFNISFGESMEMISTTKMNSEEIKRLIMAIPKMSWGDVYAFNGE